MSETNEDKIISFLETNLNIKVDRKALSEIDMAAVAKDKQLGIDIGVSGTPALYMNGKKTTMDSL